MIYYPPRLAIGTSAKHEIVIKRFTHEMLKNWTSTFEYSIKSKFYLVSVTNFYISSSFESKKLST